MAARDTLSGSCDVPVAFARRCCSGAAAQKHDRLRCGVFTEQQTSATQSGDSLRTGVLPPERLQELQQQFDNFDVDRCAGLISWARPIARHAIQLLRATWRLNRARSKKEIDPDVLS